MRKPTLQFIGLLTAVMMLPALVWAAQMTGKVQSISRKASTIQMMNLKTNEVEVIRFSKNTKFVNAKSIKEFIVNDKIVVDASPGEPAQQIKRVLVKVDPKKNHRHQGSCSPDAEAPGRLPDRRCKTGWRL